MANYTASDIKVLRAQTGAGMLDVKKALDEADGDHAKATEILRVKGQKGVAKREGRDTSNGLIALHVSDGVGVLVEVNCETDFVAKGETFQNVAQRVLDQAVTSASKDVDALLASVIDGTSVREVVDDANAAIGEKIQIRRLARVEGAAVASYVHRTSPDLPPQVGVLFATDGDSPVARDVAMHIAAMNPLYLTREDIPAEVVETEQRIAEETARNEGKPEAALPRIIEGRVNGFFKEAVLVEQPFAKDTKRTVGAVLSDAGITPIAFARFRVGV
ncbi:MAG: translation elongation factor Ts [Actinomycetota bacterium]